MVEKKNANASKNVDFAKKYNRVKCEDLLKRKFFYTQSFEIYGGVSGFYDYGPLGCALKQNVETLWRNHFVLEEDMLEVGCSNIVLDEVLKTSGHVDKFADFMVKDSKTGTPRRADKLIEDHIAKILPKKKKPEEIAELEKIQLEVETYEAAQLDEVIEKLKIKDPDTGSPLTKAELFNLMFGAAIGPTGHLHGFLRPETAQGIFINFRRLIEYNNGRMPFAAAQIGTGFRNEVSPRQGLLRVREFTMGEIEHFYDPKNRDHPKFNEVVDISFPMWTAKAQEDGSKDLVEGVNIGDAVEQGIIKNQILAYFMGRTYLFLTACGIRPEGIRFRQHKAKEMAHYANDCWDAEVETSYGWIEVSGCSDRSAFDLEKHMGKTKVELTAARLIDPIQVTNVVFALDMKVVGKEFKALGKDIKSFIEELSDEDKVSLKGKWDEANSLTVDIKGKEVVLNETHLKVTEVTKTVSEEKYTPWVIEPSFGIGRIIYCIFEHCFKSRPEDAQRTFFDFPAPVAPLKCSLLPLINRQELNDKTKEIKRMLIRAGISNKLDDTGVTVGKRYARTDECGIPYALTIDFETLEQNDVTMRDLASMKQIRLPIADIAVTIQQLSVGNMRWTECVEKYGEVTREGEEESKEEQKK